MKKYVISLLCLFMLVGCNNKIEVATIDVEFDDNYYQVYTPYKKAVSNNYVVNNVLNNYDVADVESSLMTLSTNYFKTNNSYYQSGQYLKESDLVKLLDKKELNKTTDLTIDEVKISPTYISSIYEQNYLASNGHLKGLSLAIVLNPYQAYKNSYGSYNYKTVDDNILLEFGKQAANKLVKYIRDTKKLKNIRILVGLYFEKDPESTLPGSIKYYGISSGDNITLGSINYQYQYLNASYVVKNDVNTANAFSNLEKLVKKEFSASYISGKGFYQDNILRNIEIDVNNSFFSKSELLYLCKILSDEIGASFDTKLNVRIFIKANNQVLALINKEKNTLNSSVYIMKG